MTVELAARRLSLGQVLAHGVSRIADGLDRRAQLLRRATQALAPVSDFVVLLEADQFTVQGRLARVVAHGKSPRLSVVETKDYGCWAELRCRAAAQMIWVD